MNDTDIEQFAECAAQAYKKYPLFKYLDIVVLDTPANSAILFIFIYIYHPNINLYIY